MTPVDEKSREAEIYVEGKRRMVEGFVRWCRKSNVGLSQIIQVKEVKEEEPTGLYEDFYVQS
jgi:acylphosphatase